MRKYHVSSFSNKLMAIMVAVAVVFALSIWQFGIFQSAGAATVVWNGAGATNNWNDADNWAGGAVPGAGDLAVFDETSVKDVTINANVDVAGILIDEGYTGTMTQGAIITVGTQDFVQNDGSFVGGSQNITINGHFSIDAGSFTASSGRTTFRGDVNVDASATFVHNNGTVRFNTLTLWDRSYDFTLSGDVTFHDVEFRPAEDAELFIASDATVVIEGLASHGELPHELIIGSKLLLASDTPGVPAVIQFDQDAFFMDVNFRDIHNSGDGLVECYVRCGDFGNIDGNMVVGNHGVAIGKPSEALIYESGGTSEVTAVLARKPLQDVIVSVTVSDPDRVGIAPLEVIFTDENYYVPQTFVVTAVDNGDLEGIMDVELTFAIDSLDVNYDSLILPTRSVRVLDNDFDNLTLNFDVGVYPEDVMNTVAVDSLYFVYDDWGSGNFMSEPNGWHPVDISESKIRSGCSMWIDGTEWKITAVPNAENGWVYVNLLDEVDMMWTLQELRPEGVVDAVYCQQINGQEVSLFRSQVEGRVLDDVFVDSWSPIYYDPLNDVIWALGEVDWTDVLVHVDLASGNMTVVSGDIENAGGAIDPTRGWLWWTTENDSVVVLDGATADFAFGTEGLSTFSVEEEPYAIAYDHVNDAIWVAGSDSVTKLNASDGQELGSLTGPHANNDFVGDYFQMGGITYDSVNNAVWLIVADTQAVVKIDAETVLPFDGDLSTSTYPTYKSWYDVLSFGHIKHDPARDRLYVGGSGPGWYYPEAEFVEQYDYVTVLDASDGSYIKDIPLYGNHPHQMILDEEGRGLYVVSSQDGVISRIDLDTDEVASFYVMDGMHAVAMDGRGHLWVTEYNDGGLREIILDGVPFGHYYTASVTSDRHIWVNADEVILGVEVKDDPQDQVIAYALGFGTSNAFKIFDTNENEWLVIASQRAVDHGGANGTWHYLDASDEWQVAPEGTEQGALSSAVEMGHIMTGTDLMTLGEEELMRESAIIPNEITSVVVSATFYSDNPNDHPTAQYVRFLTELEDDEGGDEGGDDDEGEDNEGGGGGGSSSTPSALSNLSVTTNACTPDAEILLTLNGSGIADYLLSESANMNGSTWQTFVATTSEGSVVPFTVSKADGEKTVYVRFRDHVHNQSSTYSVSFTLNSEGCEDPDEQSEGEEEEEESEELVVACDNVPRAPITVGDKSLYRTGFNPSHEKALWPVTSVRPGDLIRGEGISTVYCIYENNIRRPYIDETTYFTHAPSFANVKWVEDATLADFTLSHPMLPKEGSTLVKFESTEQVYTFHIDKEDSSKAILHWITTEELARAMVGDNWSDYVIDLNPALFQNFTEGDPVFSPESMDLGNLKPRLTLREAEVIGAQGSGGSLLKRAVKAVEGVINRMTR